MKLLIILLINIYLVKSSVDEVLIFGPNTPVYMCELVNGHVKVETKKQKFDNKTAKNSYDEAIHPKLLVVVDYKDYSKDGEQKSLDHAVEIIENINSDYKDLNSTPRVEALLAGVVMITERDVYSSPRTFGMNVDRRECSSIVCNDKGMCSYSCWRRPAWEDYTLSGSELESFSDWLKITAEQFEDLDYDAFIYSFPGYLAGGNVWRARTVWSLSSGTVCQSKPGAIVSNLFGYSSYGFSIELAYLLGLTHNNDKVDSHWYTYEELDLNWDKIIDWRNRTAEIVKDNYHHGKYSCLKKPVKKNDDYEDE